MAEDPAPKDPTPTAPNDSVSVSLRVPRALRAHVDNQAVLELTFEGDSLSVGELFDELARSYPAFERRVRDEQGVVRRHVNVFVGDTNIRDADQQDTVLRGDAEVSVIPAVSGG